MDKISRHSKKDKYDEIRLLRKFKNHSIKFFLLLTLNVEYNSLRQRKTMKINSENDRKAFFVSRKTAS